MSYIQSNGNDIWYEYTKGLKNTNIFLISSHMKGVTTAPTAPLIRDAAIDHGFGFIGFDPAGVGKSSGEPQEWQLETWLQNAVDVMDKTGSQQNIVFGNSMGGFMMLALALMRADKIKGLAGFNAGIGGTFWDVRGSKSYFDNLDHTVHIPVKTNHDPLFGYVDEPLDIKMPVFLVASLADEVVNYRTSVSILHQVQSRDSVVALVKDVTHHQISKRDLDRCFLFFARFD